MDALLADFMPMTAALEGPIYAAEVRHDVRITIDEERVYHNSLHSYSRLREGMPSDDEIDFVVDRPFLLAIMSNVGDPLFLGVVNRPLP